MIMKEIQDICAELQILSPLLRLPFLHDFNHWKLIGDQRDKAAFPIPTLGSDEENHDFLIKL